MSLFAAMCNELPKFANVFVHLHVQDPELVSVYKNLIAQKKKTQH